ncbi:MAG: M36 family metallopeptidase [Candidatus Ozemobacteraceae bacterium]
MNSRSLRTIFTSVICLTIVWTAPTYAFLPSPTTPVCKPATDARFTASSLAPALVEKVLADPVLAKGVERVAATSDGKRLTSIFGRLSTPLRGDPEMIARKFVEQHPSLFNLDITRGETSMRTMKTGSAASGSQVHFQLFLKEVPVLDSEISISMTRQGEVILANGSLPEITAVKNSPALDEQAAIAIARKLVGENGSRAKPSARLVVTCPSNETVYAWETCLASTEPLGDWVVLLDASTGKELDRRNDMFFFSGTGKAYLHHPLVGEPLSVELPYLSRNDMAGDYCYSLNGQGAPATSSTGVYVFNPEDTHFDEVNAYYHVNHIRDFFSKYGFNKLDFSLWTTVHFRTKFDNAFFSPKERKMYFGDGDQFNDFAKEEAIIYHEYSHGVLNEIVTLAYQEESGAIHEGQADYFACSLSDEPVLGEWISSKTEVKEIRDMRNKRHYPENISGEVHNDGRIWGAALWDLRIALGANVSDKLIYSSFYNLKPGNPKFIDGANAILAADTTVFDGKNKSVITAVFAKRGILSSSPAAAVLDGRDLEGARRFNALHEKP